MIREWICLPKTKPEEPIHEVSTVAKVNSLGSVPAKGHSYGQHRKTIDTKVTRNKSLNPIH